MTLPPSAQPPLTASSPSADVHPVYVPSGRVDRASVLSFVLPLTLGLVLAARSGVWAPWEAERARLLNVTLERGDWLTLWHPLHERPLAASPFGWWPNLWSSHALSDALGAELALRLPHVVLTALCALALFSVARRLLSPLLSSSELMLGSTLALALWWATPATLLGGTFLLSGTGALWCTLSALVGLSPLMSRASGRWLAWLTWVPSALSLGLLGALTPLIVWWVGGERCGCAPKSLMERVKPHLAPASVGVSLVGAGLSLVAQHHPLLLGGELSTWAQMFTLGGGLEGPIKASAYQGFHMSARLLAHALLPLGALLPAAAVRLWAEGRDTHAARLGDLLTAWGGGLFLLIALNATPYGFGDSSALISLLAAPFALLAAVALMLVARDGRGVSFVLTTALFWLLAFGDVKRDPSLFLLGLEGSGEVGLSAPFEGWRLGAQLSYVTLLWMIFNLTPLRELISKRLRVLGWIDHEKRASGANLLLLSALGFVLAQAQSATALSAHLSQRDLIDSFERYAHAEERLSTYGLSPTERGRSFYLNPLPTSSLEQLIKASQEGQREGFIFKRSQLARLNDRFRQATKQHLTILDDSSHEHLLAVTLPREGEPNLNPISHAVINALPQEATPLTPPMNFDDKVELIGWAMEPRTLSVGGEGKLKLYWRAKRALRRSWKVFVHIDATGQRVHGDHDPVEGLFPTTMWRAGDLIQDVHPLKVKSTLSPSDFTVYVGLYQGKTRLKIKDAPKGRATKDDRALLGRVRIK